MSREYDVAEVAASEAPGHETTGVSCQDSGYPMPQTPGTKQEQRSLTLAESYTHM